MNALFHYVSLESVKLPLTLLFSKRKHNVESSFSDTKRRHSRLKRYRWPESACRGLGTSCSPAICAHDGSLSSAWHHHHHRFTRAWSTLTGFIPFLSFLALHCRKKRLTSGLSPSPPFPGVAPLLFLPLVRTSR